MNNVYECLEAARTSNAVSDSANGIRLSPLSFMLDNSSLQSGNAVVKHYYYILPPYTYSSTLYGSYNLRGPI